MTPRSPKPGVSSTWVTSQWKFVPCLGHFSAVINTLILRIKGKPLYGSPIGTLIEKLRSRGDDAAKRGPGACGPIPAFMSTSGEEWKCQEHPGKPVPKHHICSPLMSLPELPDQPMLIGCHARIPESAISSSHKSYASEATLPIYRPMRPTVSFASGTICFHSSRKARIG